MIFDNSAASSAGFDSVAVSGPLAQSFSTGAASTQVNEVAILLATTSASTSGSTVVSLATEPPGSAGTTTTLATIANSALSAAPSLYDITLGTPITLNVSSRYWIELAAGGSGLSTAIWEYTAGDDLTGTNVASEFSYNDYNDHGSPGLADISSGLYQMCLSSVANTCVAAQQVTNSTSNPVTPAPPPPPTPDQPINEPATGAVLAAALLGLGVLRGRRADQPTLP